MDVSSSVRRPADVRSLVSSIETSPPACEFDAFVAERRGITCEQAEHLIQDWLTLYRRPGQRPVSPAAQQDDDSVSTGYDAYA